jgi:ArsR family transcriptional regulator, zinc-responsive transcriptional repressor
MGKTAREKSLSDLDCHQASEEPLEGRHVPLLQDEHYHSVAFLAKSLSDENRLRIILCVSSGKKSVSSIVEELGLSQPLVSHHLKGLKRSLLVKIERNGPFIYYELVDPRILEVIRTLSTVATDLLTARKTF